MLLGVAYPNSCPNGGPPPPASRPCCAITTAAPPMRFALGALLPLKGEDIGVLTVLATRGSPTRTGAQRVGPVRPLRGGHRCSHGSCYSGSPTRTGAQRVGPLRPLRGHLPLNGENIVVLTVRELLCLRVRSASTESLSPEPIDAQSRQPARDQALVFEPCEPSRVGTGPAQGVQGDVRSEASSPPAGGPTSTVDTVFCRRSARLVRVRDP